MLDISQQSAGLCTYYGQYYRDTGRGYHAERGCYPGSNGSTCPPGFSGGYSYLSGAGVLGIAWIVPIVRDNKKFQQEIEYVD